MSNAANQLQQNSHNSTGKTSPLLPKQKSVVQNNRSSNLQGSCYGIGTPILGTSSKAVLTRPFKQRRGQTSLVASEMPRSASTREKDKDREINEGSAVTGTSTGAFKKVKLI